MTHVPIDQLPEHHKLMRNRRANGECQECGGASQPMHPCPWKQEQEDDDSECNCCDDCRRKWSV